MEAVRRQLRIDQNEKGPTNVRRRRIDQITNLIDDLPEADEEIKMITNEDAVGPGTPGSSAAEGRRRGSCTRSRGSLYTSHHLSTFLDPYSIIDCTCCSFNGSGGRWCGDGSDVGSRRP